MSDHYQTLAGSAEFRQKIERSEFLAIAFAVQSEGGFFERLALVTKQHFAATHHCWALRLRERSRSADAGEPAGTAGRPILVAIEGANLFETGVVVVRWYGGVKLGTGGLSRAYRDTAARALLAATRIDRYEYSRFEVSVPFDAFGSVYRLVEPPDVLLAGETFGEGNLFEFDVRTSRCEGFVNTLNELRLTFKRR